MSTYGGVVKEIPILQTPIGSASGLIRGDLVEISSDLAVIWGGSNAVYGVCIGDADNDLHLIDVYTGGGASVQVRCDTGVVPDPGDLLYYSSATGVKIAGGTAGEAIGIAVGNGMNGMVEAVLFPGGIAEQDAIQTALNAMMAATATLGAAEATFGAAWATWQTAFGAYNTATATMNTAEAAYATAIAVPVTTVGGIVTAEATLAAARATYATAQATFGTAQAALSTAMAARVAAWATYTTAIAAI